MWYLTIIRILAIIFFGITTYSTLLWIIGWKVPGRPRRQIPQDSKYCRRNTWIILIYKFLLAILVILVFLLIKSIARGEL